MTESIDWKCFGNPTFLKGVTPKAPRCPVCGKPGKKHFNMKRCTNKECCLYDILYTVSVWDGHRSKPIMSTKPKWGDGHSVVEVSPNERSSYSPVY